MSQTLEDTSECPVQAGNFVRQVKEYLEKR